MDFKDIWKIRSVWVDAVNKERIFIENIKTGRIILKFDFPTKEDKSNLNFICCAPEMLEMLIDIRDWIDKDINASECRTQIDELIKKATTI